MVLLVRSDGAAPWCVGHSFWRLQRAIPTLAAGAYGFNDATVRYCKPVGVLNRGWTAALSSLDIVPNEGGGRLFELDNHQFRSFFWTNRPTDQQTNRPTDQQTNSNSMPRFLLRWPAIAGYHRWLDVATLLSLATLRHSLMEETMLDCTS